MLGGPWTTEENALVIDDYFDMLEADIGGWDYVKTEHNEKLQTKINRTHGLIEYKHRNISVVLQVLGETWIGGYRPASNFQASLYPEVERRLRQWDGALMGGSRKGEEGEPRAARKFVMGVATARSG